MGELKHVEFSNFAIPRTTDGNPECKGLSGFLLDWYKSEARGLVAKPRRQLLAEFFTAKRFLPASIKSFWRPSLMLRDYS